ncbi:MAG TPA: AAA family ATPase [Actinomycetes bacterium]
MSTPSLVGRDAELARLRQAAAAAAAGSGGLVLVTGEAGIGKTSLIDAALRGTRPPLPAAWGTCREGAGVPGLWPWAEVLRSCQEAGLVTAAEEPAALALGALAALAEREAGDADESMERFRVFDAVGRTLRRAAADRPLAVVLDDLHWADAGSLRLLRFLAPDLHRSRLLVVGAYRDDEAGAEGALLPLLDGLASRAATLPLRHLDQRQVGELVTRLGGERPSGAALAAIHRRTGGNPFFVQQVTQLGAELSDPPAGVRDVVGRRLERLPRSCVELLEVAAVVGREAGTRVLARATGRPPAEVVGALDAAVGARVVEPAAGDAVRFAHDLFREAVYAGLDSVTRARLHGRVADALEEVTPPTQPGLAADLARHRVAATAVGEPAEALPYVRRAAAEASAGLAFEEAAVHLAEGVRLAALAADPEAHRALLLELGDAHRRAGDLGEARRGYLRAAADARAAGDATALARAALGVHHVGAATWSSHQEAIELLEEALAARGETPDPETARLLAGLARELAHGPGDRERALPTSERAVAMARDLGDPPTLALCLFAQHDAVWAPGSARRRLEVLDEMAAAATAARDPVLGWEALFGRFVALLELADPAAYPVFLQVVEAADRLGQPHYQWIVHSRRAVLAMLAGRLDEAESLIDRVAAGAERLGEPDGPNVVGQLIGSLAATRGDLATVAEGMAAVGAAGGLPPWIAASWQAMVRLHQGDAAGAAELVRPWAEQAIAQSRGWQVLGAAATVAEVAAAARDEPLCALAERLLRPHAGGLVVTGGAVEVAGPVSFYLGLLAGAAGRPQEALGHVADALAQAERMDARPWVARLHHQLGVTLAERGGAEDRQAAERHLRAAADGAERLRLAFLADQARARLGLVAAPENVFRREGDVWALGFGGMVVRLPDAKGLRDIARLLAAPGKDLPAAVLLGSEASAEAATGSDPVLDETARSAYRRRLADLDEEIGDAEQAADPERAARARAERDQLVDALSAAYGLGGRARRLGDAAERARKTVTARIRDSLGRIEARHPQLGDHLRASIVTGTACSYRPAEQVRWRL